MADLEAEFLGIGQVLLDIALGVDDDGGRTGLVSEQIGGVGQAAQVVLFQNHGSSIGAVRSSFQSLLRPDGFVAHKLPRRSLYMTKSSAAMPVYWLSTPPSTQ